MAFVLMTEKQLIRENLHIWLQVNMPVNTFPGNADYEISGNANVEWYDCVNGENTDADYHSAIWIPVKRK